MKNLPDRLYLQIEGEDGIIPDTWEELCDTYTTCSERVHKSDVLYYREEPDLKDFFKIVADEYADRFAQDHGMEFEEWLDARVGCQNM